MFSHVFRPLITPARAHPRSARRRSDAAIPAAELSSKTDPYQRSTSKQAQTSHQNSRKTVEKRSQNGANQWKTAPVSSTSPPAPEVDPNIDPDMGVGLDPGSGLGPGVEGVEGWGGAGCTAHRRYVRGVSVCVGSSRCLGRWCSRWWCSRARGAGAYGRGAPPDEPPRPAAAPPGRNGAGRWQRGRDTDLHLDTKAIIVSTTRDFQGKIHHVQCKTHQFQCIIAPSSGRPGVVGQAHPAAAAAPANPTQSLSRQRQNEDDEPSR